MTVRDKAGRRRFVLFDIPGDPDAGMGRVITLFNDRCRELRIDRRDIRFRVIYAGEGIGIVRCSHLAKDTVLDMINSTELGSENLSTVSTDSITWIATDSVEVDSVVGQDISGSFNELCVSGVGHDQEGVGVFSIGDFEYGGVGLASRVKGDVINLFG